jgi:hypothetical protein
VFIITILVAGGCTSNEVKDTEPTPEDTRSDLDFALGILNGDSTKVFVYLKDTLIDGRKHLEMHNVKHTGEQGKKVIDTLTTVVYPKYTVHWKKTTDSEIQRIHLVRIVDSKPWDLKDTCLVGVESEEAEERGTTKFVIPSNADTGTVKYEIIFQDKDKNIWCIDPHLKIPPR